MLLIMRMVFILFLLSVEVIHSQSVPLPKIRVLVLTGRNNHEWKKTTPEIVAALMESGRFQVDVEVNVPAMKPEQLQAYDVILSNFNTFPAKDEVWDSTMRKAFEKYMKQGHGLVIVHAGSAVFNDWPFFQQLACATWGAKSHHAKIHENQIRFTDVASPITAGLPPFTTTDEYWEDAQVDSNANRLAVVTPKPDFGGSGKEEPILFSTQVEGARGFNILLGHAVEGIDNPVFRELLQRGTEWAATGKVTIK